jgi:type I restriction enzyme S subunit
MSHYKPYPAYKDSEVEWLGRVPEHWAVCKLSFRYSIELGKMLDEKRLTKTSLVPYLRNQDVQWGSINTQDLPEMDIHPEELERYTIRDGDLLVCEGGDVGRAAIWRGESAAFGYQKALHRLRHRSVGADTAEFFYFSLLTAKQRGVFEESDSKATIAHLPAEKFRQYRFAFPSLSEQRCIAAHLDRETARIDALIEKKTRFIELLREKRQALITHAVTKGLDPNAKMKDSGVEWLGEVPEHWDALPLRRVVTAVKTGGTPSEEQPSPDADGLAWYTPGDFGNSLVLTSSEKRVSALAVSTGEAKVYPAGVVLVVSIGATLGKVGYLVESASANQQINAVIPNSRVSGYFLAYSLSVKTEEMWFLANAATIGIMNQEKTKEIWLAVPSPSEQKAITEYLDKGTGRLDSLIGKTERSIELLKERRSALITAAVTGQIDLREAV